MQYTSAAANKLLKKLNDEYLDLINKENRTKDFKASLGEDVESVRPDYDYDACQDALAKVEGQIRTLKHAINVFNTTHIVEGFDMSIDQMLVYIPQLTKRKAKLAAMKAKLPKERVANEFNRSSNIIDYCYINYDLNSVEADYQATSELLNQAQIALDVLNNTETFEVEL